MFRLMLKRLAEFVVDWPLDLDLSVRHELVESDPVDAEKQLVGDSVVGSDTMDDWCEFLGVLNIFYWRKSLVEYFPSDKKSWQKLTIIVFVASRIIIGCVKSTTITTLARHRVSYSYVTTVIRKEDVINVKETYLCRDSCKYFFLSFGKRPAASNRPLAFLLFRIRLY